MFIQFFIWGSWYVTGPRVLGPLGFGGAEFGWMYSVGPIAGLISPFFVGMIADRFFATERVLGVMHLGAAGAMYGAMREMQSEAPSPDTILWLFFAHMLFYFPTLSLTNTLAMHNLSNTEKQFPMIRVFGTIGWIVAGLVLAWRGWGNTIEMFQMAIYAGVGLGVFSFLLPHTPPPSKGQAFSAREGFGLDAFVLLAKPSFAIFMFCSFLICIPLAFYYNMAERTLGAGEVQDTPLVMTYGQMSEILFMLVMPFFFVKLGVKWMLFVGMLAWVTRYGLFTYGAPEQVQWMLILGVVLHGICYDFFFVTGQIYTDRVAPSHIRGQAQGMLVLFTLGLGMFIGAKVAGVVEGHYTPDTVADLNAEVKKLGDEIERLEAAATPDAAEIETLTTKKAATELEALQAIEWGKIWMIPAIGAAVVMVFFALAFRERRGDRSDGEDPGSVA